MEISSQYLSQTNNQHLGKIMKILLSLTGLILLLTAIGCSGPNYYLNEGESPAWLRQTTSTIGGAKIQMIGTAPITSQVKNDYDLGILITILYTHESHLYSWAAWLNELYKVSQ